MPEPQIALHARVSSDQQARGNTVASQLATLRERIATAGLSLDPGNEFIDDGRSGTTLMSRFSSSSAPRASTSKETSRA